MNPLTVWRHEAGPKAGEAGPEDSPKRGLSGHRFRRPR